MNGLLVFIHHDSHHRGDKMLDVQRGLRNPFRVLGCRFDVVDCAKNTVLKSDLSQPAVFRLVDENFMHDVLSVLGSKSSVVVYVGDQNGHGISNQARDIYHSFFSSCIAQVCRLFSAEIMLFLGYVFLREDLIH